MRGLWLAGRTLGAERNVKAVGISTRKNQKPGGECEQEMDGDGAGGDRMGLSGMGDEDVDLEAEGQSGLRHSHLCPLW